MESRRYVITVRGRLSQRFAASFEGLTLEAGERLRLWNELLVANGFAGGCNPSSPGARRHTDLARRAP